MTHLPQATLRAALKALRVDADWLRAKVDENADAELIKDARDELRDSMDLVRELIGDEEES